jgi:hypothetical protein
MNPRCDLYAERRPHRSASRRRSPLSSLICLPSYVFPHMSSLIISSARPRSRRSDGPRSPDRLRVAPAALARPTRRDILLRDTGALRLALFLVIRFFHPPNAHNTAHAANPASPTQVMAHSRHRIAISLESIANRGGKPRNGGGGGNRTRVLEPRGQSVYARSLRFEFARPVSRRPDTDPASSLSLSRSSRSEEARSSRLRDAHSPPAGAAGGASLLN